MLLKEYLSDSGGGQHCAAQSSKELPSASQDLSAHGSPSLNQSQEIKVSIIYMTKDPFNLLQIKGLSFFNQFSLTIQYTMLGVNQRICIPTFCREQ